MNDQELLHALQLDQHPIVRIATDSHLFDRMSEAIERGLCTAVPAEDGFYLAIASTPEGSAAWRALAGAQQ